MKYQITEKRMKDFEEQLYSEEKQQATVEKYLRDLKKLADFADGRELSKKLMVEYKETLKSSGEYKTRSINSYLVAANRFLEFMGWYDFRVKTFRVQREAFRSARKNLTKKDYRGLVKTAGKRGKARLAMLIQAICATGLRVSELEMITVKAVRKGAAHIYCKGKERKVFLPHSLRKELLYYIAKNKIKEGPVFCTAGGKPLDRSNIWREMKALSKEAGINPEKVFPHNLRHLFARTYYEMNRDIGKLADILGHGSIETTRIYIRASSGEHLKQLDGMGLVFSP